MYNDENGDGMFFSIASMVLGIISLIIPCMTHVSIPASIIGLILGIISVRGKKAGRGMAIAGIVTSLITLGLYVLTCIGVLGVFSFLGNLF